MNDKWYDFKDTAKVELRSLSGLLFVRVQFPVEPVKEQLSRAYTIGWSRVNSGDGTHVFDHHAAIKSLSDVSARLEGFFSKERIAAALRPIELPDIELQRPPSLPSRSVEEILERFSEEAPTPLMDHIRASIARAKTITGARQSAARQLPFGGDGRGIFDRLAQRSDASKAALWVGTVLLAISQQDEDWEQQLGAIMEADAAGSTVFPNPHPVVAEHVGRMAAIFRVIKDSGLSAKSVTDALFAEIVEQFGHRIGYRAYDGAVIEPTGAPDLAKNSFTAQAGVSNEVAADAKARLTSALTACGRSFGLARDRLFDGNEIKFMLGTAVSRLNADVQGKAATYRATANVGGDKVTLTQRSIHLSPTTPGALIHEIGHQVHGAGNEAEILRVVKDHEFSRSSRRIVSLLEEKGQVDPTSAAYLVSPQEIFARAFDAHVHAQAGPIAAGGAFATIGSHPMTPVGEELTAFMSDMRAVVLEQRTEAKLATKSEEDVEVDRPAAAVRYTAMGM